MLVYNEEFDTEMNKILETIIPFKKANYKIKGTYYRKNKYITDIDIVLKLPKFFSTISDDEFGNVMQKTLRKYIFTIPNKGDLIFIHMICGDDPRLIIKTKDDLSDLFDKQLIDITDMDKFLKMSVDEINEQLSSYRKLRWTKKEILSGTKEKNNQVFNLSDVLAKNKMFVLVFAQFYPDNGEGTDIYGFDIACIDSSIKLTDVYENHYQTAIQRTNDEGYPYFILRLIAKVINHRDHQSKKPAWNSPKNQYTNNPVVDEINDINENILGGYKQLMVKAQLTQKLILGGLLNKDQLQRIFKGFYDDLDSLGETKLLNALKMENPLAEMEIIEHECLREMNQKALPYLKKIAQKLDPELRKELILINI